MMHVVLFLQDVVVVGAGHGHRKDAPPSGNKVHSMRKQNPHVLATPFAGIFRIKTPTLRGDLTCPGS